MCERIAGKVGAVPTPIGLMPREGDLTLDGLDISKEDMAELMKVDVALFKKTLADAEEYLATFGSKLPARMTEQLQALKARLG
jgi:phosphoenolpyruvate carboxykinase (GTP)